MDNRIVRLRVRNFKCFDSSRFYEYRLDSSRNPVILSGPNGFGKTTFFDAIELIFAMDITRLVKIEKSNFNLGKNLLLNEADKDGYVALTLQDDKAAYTTLIAKISHNIQKINIEKSITYAVLERDIQTNELNQFICDYNEWQESLITKLKYYKDFSVYYYVSQAESVHFLKKSIEERKNIMNVMLKTDDVDEKKRIIHDDLIGDLITYKSDLNDELRSTTATINVLVERIKSNSSFESNKCENIDLGFYDKNNVLFYWDNPKIEDCSLDIVKKASREVDGLECFISNISDYYIAKRNSDINAITSESVLEDYRRFRQYLIKDKISSELIYKEINELDETIKIVSNAKLFLSGSPSVSMYDENSIERLKALLPELNDVDFSPIRKVVNELKEEEKSLSSNQSIIRSFMEARTKLKEVSEQCQCNNATSIDSATCPFCKSSFPSDVDLMVGFESVDVLLKEEGGHRAQRVNNLKKEFENEIFKVTRIIEMHLGDRKGIELGSLSNKASDFTQFISNNGRVGLTEKLDKYLSQTDFNSDTSDADLISEIRRALLGLIGKIQNPEYSNLAQKYDFESISRSYNLYLEELKETASLDSISKKKEFLLSLINESNYASVLKDKQELKELVKRQKKLEKTRKNLDDLREFYTTKLTEYVKSISGKLRVPLLIYTAKILQDYQNGLGVFIESEDMRFVSNGDSRLDILNTFSSGQLSGFVIAFLFAMNKQYVNDKANDLGFILVDDPIQTMDDINIASMIEVLRNDFADKQIILSTHETDKENYILYKFYKNNLIGQSFNVKKELYDLNL